MRLFSKVGSAVLGTLLVVAASTVIANDRPFEVLTSAIAEDDDERNFGVSGWVSRSKGVRSGNVAVEYNVSPMLSFELTTGLAKPRPSGPSEKSLEFEALYKFTDAARTGYGLGVEFGIEYGKVKGSKFERESVHLSLPLSIPVLEKTGTIHAIAGMQHVQGDKSRLRAGVGYMQEITKGLFGFVEFAGRQRDYTLVNAGVRYWVKKEKFALDAAVARIRPHGGGSTEGQVTIGFTVQDLSF